MRDDPHDESPGILPLAGREAGFKVDDRWLLQQADFEIAAGGLTAILGGSGRCTVVQDA